MKHYVKCMLPVTTDVRGLVSRFRELNETADILASLERIGEESRELFVLGRPVQGLIAAAINNSLEVRILLNITLHGCSTYEHDKFSAHLSI